ncbi:hypothetical protein N473_24110 [Pseudoalteromonas luteoviolacea CPMOR-1]|uniref:N-acetyltransferase domain-containing protein n=1 Tax=Pseudoalteromonas luteoviolacea CPMOR-1 TaxID=1365248 RepID=A0A161Y1U7_9GAMM|nr:N-acetyltransferase [Pseudoalteromonas luteoviolacea]KZN60574.1 hypothetical protein N473_24110 [Pseudoalteromonas luteoviolacea CPMOR-1]
MTKRQKLIKKMTSKVAHLEYKAFSVESIGGADVLADYLHQAYCTKDAVVQLGYVCPHCKGNQFSVDTGTYHNKTRCPTCDTSLVSFWSPSRTQHYFSSKQNSLGYLAFDQGKLIGLIWGFPRTLPSDTKPGLYADMIIINKELHKTKLGMGLIFKLTEYFLSGAKAQGYCHMIGRTQIINAPLVSTFKLMGGTEVGPDPSDPKTRTLWSFSLI